MDYEIREGNYCRMGIIRKRNAVVFTFEGEKEDACALVLIDRKTRERLRIPVPEEYCLGSVRSVEVSGISVGDYYYYYEINGEEKLDEYAPMIAGREVWNDESRKECEYRIYGVVSDGSYQWREDRNPEIREQDMIMYKLHIRGFTMDTGSEMAAAGTFRGLEGRIPYLQNLGITTIELMPVYEFEEMAIPVRQTVPDYITWEEREDDLIPRPVLKEEEGPINYWGYGPGNYFAVKASYAKNPQEAPQEFKHLVNTLHRAGMECVMEMFFPVDTNQNLILEVLRYWVREYHVDGFHLLGDRLPITAIVQDRLLSRTKIFHLDIHAGEQLPHKFTRLFVYKEEYQYPVRKILNHINADMKEFLNQQRKQGEDHGYVNYVASNNGFTLADVFMYKDKHNEANGENNEDGDTWNFSSNYGVEGPTRKRFVVLERRRQWRNAMIMLFLAQGIPLIWSGDEFGNSQKGNNNAYCQDNPVGWVNWRRTREFVNNKEFVRGLSVFRRNHPLIARAEPFAFADPNLTGFPDLSYHGDNAWISQVELGRMSIGLLYNGAYAPEGSGGEDIYVAYNFYTRKVALALPRLPRKWKWYLAIDSADENNSWLKGEVLSHQQKYVTVEPQSIRVLVAK